ncbi:hypothetical protein EZV73_23440 [Acidaminobacter sp. JC074]|uniref:hypothetical protein n=1 Tax=Acidaminobacter sp. JC074 TaxID=2530199 RepID=UPI001F115DA4|nr:hypothetical protein [Acidaminobacter sp. JC074]MCH4890555.1 hypothetical protein [Acidaminobacter sp. JC074]
MKQYTWHLDRLTALMVGLTNVLLTLYLSIRFLTDTYFFKTQFGFILQGMGLVVLLVGLVAGAIYLNYQFIRKNHTARLILSLGETICLACILRNIFIGHMYFGFGFSAYIRNLLAFAVMSAVIYHTMFSSQIQAYFQEKKSRGSN